MALPPKYLRLAVVTVIVVLGAGLSWFEPQTVLMLRESIWDRYVEFQPREWDPDLAVRIIDIDEASLDAHGQWPWPRTRIARLVDALGAYGVRVVVFDVIFAEADATSLDRVFEALQRDVPGYVPPIDAETRARQPDNDAILAAALRRLPVVLGLSVETTASGMAAREIENLPRVGFERRKDQRYLPRFPGAISSLTRLQEAAATNAAIDMRADPDGVTRKAPMLVKIGKRTVPSLAAAAVLVAGDGTLHAETRTPGLRSVVIGALRVPTDRYGYMRLYDSGSVRERYVSAADVLAGRVPEDRLAGAIAIVGTGAEGLHDLRLTPLERWIPGMEIHAQAIEQVLSGVFLERPDWGSGAEALASLLGGLLLLSAIWLRWQRVPPWSIAAVLGIALAAASWVAFAEHRRLLDVALPIATLLVASMLERLLLVLELRRERSAVRSAFSRYLAPALVEQLAADPDRLRLGGETRVMTFLFCDIRGFTAISERFEHDPEGLTGLINRFLTPMTDAILAGGGCIDKYMGDCIMAFWNAPLEEPDHPAAACRSALAMRAVLRTLNDALAAEAEAAGSPPIALRIGIGLNTGTCVVGNVGSEQRFDYSVLGDAVNLASRLEGQSKTYGVDILIGEDTQEAAPDFAALELDRVAVKGRAAAVRIYTLLGDPGLRDSTDYRSLADAQSAMLAAYRSRAWDTARAHLRRCRAVALPQWDLESVFALYEERIARFEADPPDADWDGVTVAQTK